MELLIKNASILDGTGKAAYTGDIGIANGKLVLEDLPQTADQIIDATGKFVAPGFIDTHSHGDELIGGASFGDLCKVNQGVTTQIAGQCGHTFAPTSAEYRLDPVVSVESVNPQLTALRHQGLSWKGYMEFADSVPKVTNFKFFVGFDAIRTAVMGYENRRPTATELEQMKAHLKEAMECGAGGMSSGLAYVPAAYAETWELIEMANVMAPYGGIYTTHMRNESYDLLASVEEAIEIGRQAGVAVNISHFKVMGRSNWGTHWQAIEAIEKARAEGIDITCDQYPYNCSMTTYTPCMPPWHFAGGKDQLIEKLKQPEFRRQVQREMTDPATDYENLYLNSGGWEGISICTSPNVAEAEGLTVAAYAQKIGKDPFDAYFDLVIDNHGAGTAVYHSISDDDIFDIIRLPYVMVGSDGIVNSRHEKCHPRGWGTMVRAICEFTKKNHILSLEELIFRITAMPAKRYSLAGKGMIQQGYDADLVIFDYDALTDNATYNDPTALAGGIEYVFIGGKIVYHDGQLTGEAPGKIL